MNVLNPKSYERNVDKVEGVDSERHVWRNLSFEYDV